MKKKINKKPSSGAEWLAYWENEAMKEIGTSPGAKRLGDEYFKGKKKPRFI